ncbi:MAG: mannose-6-phosphate isomerase, class I [Deltaproteobacteria bacterium]|jgi:mannose-6-phosphate isomerase|nr:mannose-6-phosphate isomerase, class I [Deltaproteobacteria bacterium]
MRTIKLLKNTVQNYAWGSPTAIPELLGEQNPSHEPRAELWMGAHLKAPSLVNYDGQWMSLAELITKFPQEILGNDVALAFGNKLPYLFKVLAAAKPLSIQAHPNLNQAKKGFKRETDRGIAMDAPNRNYKDDNHKPECICALSPFWAMYGFRNIPDILTLMGKNCPVGLAAELDSLKRHPDSRGLKRFFTDLMTMDSRRQKRVVDEAVQNAHQYSDEDIAFYWMTRLSNGYPTDIGILAPLLLNLIELGPGEALFLPAGELHAYLEGVGMEVMANSDNVLRGGLTPKHIDVPELLKVLHFKPRPVNILKAVKKNKNERVYASEADEFVLSVVSTSAGSPYQSSESRSVEIILCTEGTAYLKDEGTQEIINIKKGESAIIPAAVIGYSITGDALIYKAAVP